MYKRKRNKRTDYRKRLKYLISRNPRLVIRRSNAKITTQIIEYTSEGDKTLVTANSKELLKLGYNGKAKNIPSAYLTGLLIAKKAREKAIKTVVPDIGFYAPIKGSFPFAVINGAKDGGLSIGIDKAILPEESRMKGEHIASFAKSQNKNEELINLSNNIEQIKIKLLEK